MRTNISKQDLSRAYFRVKRPTKVEVVINLNAAKALGIKIPQSLLLRADEVIQ